MIKNHYLTFFVFISLFFLSNNAFSQLSKTHYIPPLTNANSGSSRPQDQYIYLSTPRNSNIPFTIKPVGAPTTSYITGVVSNANPREIPIGSGSGQLFIPSNSTSLVTNNRGFIIEAEDVIYVSVRMNAGFQAGALVSKGLASLGTAFRVGSFTNENPQDNYLNFVSVMATEDDTQVNFSNLPTGLIIKNYTGATPVNVTLNEGESYTIATNSNDTPVNRDGLIGCLVNSNKPIVVNCGSANGSFGNGDARDFGIDQIVDLSKIGTEYIFVRGDGNDAWENVLIVAHSDNTAISINGNASMATINAGQYFVIEGDNYSANGNMFVETSQPAFAYQGVGGLGLSGGPEEANQGMFFVPPLSCETRGNLDNIANINNIGSKRYEGGISIVTKSDATVTINGNPIGVGSNPVPGKTDYVTYKVKGLNGNISVECNDELYCAYFNYNGAATSGSFYSGFPSAPEINFDAQFATLGNCIPNISLEAANAQSFDSFRWLFDDNSGTGFQDLLINTASMKPTQPGRYKLIGIITCTGEELESIEIPISMCPDDRDNDGIIDNIDIDNDNDGILNCTESRGDVVLDLSNTRPPRLRFQDGSIDATIATDMITTNRNDAGTSSIRLTGTGNITSDIPATDSSNNDYTINFTEPVNVKFSEDTSVVHTSVNGEFFIAKVLPLNKNITLVDPDDRLLVDTNFDGIFETGVTMVSGSEIHFKINPTPSGSTSYDFFANQVDGFSFAHYLDNLTDDSSFTGNISLTCFKKDHDLDGVKDAFDLDSDNDGIPDSIENQGILLPLSGIDLDLNGLDDVYDSSLLPIDSDKDTILDMYDLDSDNDGISDLIETGQLGTLSDTDLNGIEDGPNYGINGWTDAAETAPDSDALGYTLNNFDNDTLFSYLDPDSDGDGCSDTIEAGFSDGNEDDFLGDTPPTTNVNGLVNNATDGYTLPDSDYLTNAPLNITTQPENTITCSLSETLINVVSPEAETFQWEFSIDGTTWADLADNTTYTGSQTANLVINATPLTINNYTYRVKLDRIGNCLGIYSDEIKLTVNALPIANTVPDMNLCDANNNGSTPFNLTLQNNAISAVSGITITYHLSQADADGDINPISSPFESGNATIYARVENSSAAGCYATSNFDIRVYESAFPTSSETMTALQECDNNSVGNDADGYISFDLTQKETEILNGQSPSDFTISYFTDAAYLNQINTPTAFGNSIADIQTIYVRVSNNLFTNCYTDTNFDIQVFRLPQANPLSTYAQCDDDSNDGQAFFNLTLDTIKEELNPNFMAEGLVFTYYKTQPEAINASNPIVNPDTYQDALGFTTETVWIRVENSNMCFRVVPLNLDVNPSSAALAGYTPTAKFQCDDGTDNRDGISIFDLTDISNDIRTNIFPSFNINIHFYESQIDAELETNEILDIANHSNANAPNVQSIWVRVKSDLGKDCLGLQAFPNLLNVEALPTAYPVTIAKACDFNSLDSVLSHPFDVSQLEADVLNGQNPLNVTITYFDSDNNPLLYADGRPVTSPINSEFLSENQTITIRVTNNNTQDPNGACYDETTLEFLVDAQPIANPVAPQSVCDGDANDIDDDGFYPFDTSSFTNAVLGAQIGMDIFYNYTDENGTTQNNKTSIPNPLISSNQNIRVEVVNPENLACSATTIISLSVNPLPEFTVETPQTVCISDPDFSILLEPFESNSSGIYNYEWLFTSIDGTTTDQFISNTRTLSVSTPGTYSISLTNTDGTGCSRSKDIFVEPSEIATITRDQVTINDLSENNSVTIDTTNLGIGSYQYALQEKGTSFIVYQDEPVFNNVSAGFYTIYVKDDICGVAPLDISVIGYPKYFTPNGDGVNDLWKIEGVNDLIQPNTTVLIYDRYGKLIKQLLVQYDGWDGTHNGHLMPTDDYWFKVSLEDGRQFSGHFSLKR